MARIPTKEIVINGRKKIVNADDPRTGDHFKPAPKKRGRPKKADS